ncbi:hypothetical protein [Marinoscillum furvescens]|uniref:Secreted protein n=1 Tax=Marinoscillum furvescens DSM 4134 TaxID=1122208 RepID=A0A3D9L4H8_MARFU|nr:hypothetical protein [Marinoscillum furvescens]RED97537.1 hypothetical protein C7460_112148 [Marinoscillum furvescens DSM 4134]
MNRIKSIFSLVLLATAFMFGACSQDETMDDLMNNSEINTPSPTNGDDTEKEGDQPGG